jgi:hypothetical protein
MRIEIAVGEIVDHAAGRAHQHRPQHENPHHPPVRSAERRKPQPPQRRPEQQQDADRLVEAHQPFVKVEPLAQSVA